MYDIKKHLGEERYNDLYVRHGSCFDRGSADSYYRRGFSPHYYVGATGFSEKIERENMTPEEIAAYTAGYYENDGDGDFKDWGRY